MSSPGSPVSETALSGSLSVYAEKGYQTALERVFRTLNLRHPLLDMQWADTPAGADIVITDRLPAEEAGQYRTLDNVADPLRDVLIPELVLRDERGVLGLPLFLRCDSYWYDTLLYQKPKAPFPIPWSLSVRAHCCRNSPWSATYKGWSICSGVRPPRFIYRRAVRKKSCP